MTTSKRLAAFRVAQTSDDEPETQSPARPDEDETNAPGKEPAANAQKETNTMTEEEHKAALAAAETQAEAKGFAAANARTTTVLASEHYAGREGLAQALLANDKLSADEIVDALGKAEAKAETPAPVAGGQPDPDAAARAEMKAALDETGNSNVDAAAGGKIDKKANADAVWAYAWGTDKEGSK